MCVVFPPSRLVLSRRMKSACFFVGLVPTLACRAPQPFFRRRILQFAPSFFVCSFFRASPFVCPPPRTFVVSMCVCVFLLRVQAFLAACVVCRKLSLGETKGGGTRI